MSACPASHPHPVTAERSCHSLGTTPRQNSLILLAQVIPAAAPGWERPGQREAAHRLQGLATKSCSWLFHIQAGGGGHPRSCPVLSCPELIPEILFHSTSTKSQAETRSHSKARPEPASIPTVWAAEALQRGQTAALRARQGTQSHLTMEKQPDIPLRALDTLLLGYTHPNLIQRFSELLLC